MANNQSVRRHLDAFTRGRIIGKLEEGRSVTIVVVHEEPHLADDRYIVLQARRNRRQTAGEITRQHDTGDWTTDIAFYRGQKADGGGLFAPTPCTVCTFSACPSEKAFSVVPGTPELERQ
ncbi:hypothetical protein TNCV_4130211 [Trichonephila clavipes]|nr:hypothetical protein TNCV_4130211 [Trichonephila clavipes]